VVPGLLLVGLGAGLLLPTATNSVVGSVPQGDSGTGSASNAVALQVGGAIAVAARAGGATGALLTHAARAAFMSGNEIALAVGAAVALGGVVLVLARPPLRVSRDSPDPQRQTTTSAYRSHVALCGVTLSYIT
jgi:hypothetical protein